MSELKELTQKVNHFTKEREWEQFHSPKNLSMALACEAAELMEEFQWLTEEASAKPEPEKLQNIRDEIGDVFIYLLRICDVLGIDILEAGFEKFRKNELKYPANLCRGSSKKYTEYK